jgi:predicted RNA binding protein YcfA (HicA-like mRNA interferase family)
MSKATYDDVVAHLTQRSHTTTCKDLLRFLEGLGFVTRAGKSGKHYTYRHPKITGFRGNFDCGHGRNPDVLPVYIRNVLDVLEEYEIFFKN